MAWQDQSRPQAGPRLTGWHYAWMVALVTFAVLLVSAGVRTVAGVLINPLESEFGWSRANISLAVSVSIL
jgi:hypothetical protein